MKSSGTLLAGRLHQLDGTNELGLFQKHQSAELLDAKRFGISRGGSLEVVGVDLICNLFFSVVNVDLAFVRPCTRLVHKLLFGMVREASRGQSHSFVS